MAQRGGDSKNTDTDMEPALYGYPAVADSFDNSYDYPLMALLGSVAEGDAAYNYDKQGNLLAQGAPIKRNFALDEYEFYVQDSWHIKADPDCDVRLAV